ncbi:MAG: hypothetical protein Pg6C_02680 [Treponemataceae bacterium]|nr:MAG: hypothetical protein Pg6C_02680 [Treponemataceae bacterium]
MRLYSVSAEIPIPALFISLTGKSITLDELAAQRYGINSVPRYNVFSEQGYGLQYDFSIP